MDIRENILETIGNTPLIRINKLSQGIPGTILAKVEYFNPGHSIKDRMALKMIQDAEERGDLKPGGTIIECTSGNTGMGLALVGCVKGYKCIFTTTDKQSKEKVDVLKAVGAEVIVCPTNVGPEHPSSYYSVAERLSKEIPNSFWCNQYDNLSNTTAHYEGTGPEIWEQTDGKITHMIVGVGTGGTVSGTAKFLKEKNPDIKIWGVDTYGSVFKKYHETGKFDEEEIYPYITEGIGEDILPKNVNFELVDHFEKVTDKDGAIYARRLAKEEGLLLGYSCGSAMAGLVQLKDRLKETDVVVIIFHDHGSRYVGKIYNDEWMRERGFLSSDLTVSDLLTTKSGEAFISVESSSTVKSVLDVMKSKNISQLPVTANGELIGSVTESAVLTYILDNPLNNPNKEVKSIIGSQFPEVAHDLPINELRKYLTKEVPAVITKDMMGQYQVITQYDIIQNL